MRLAIAWFILVATVILAIWLVCQAPLVILSGVGLALSVGVVVLGVVWAIHTVRDSL